MAPPPPLWVYKNNAKGFDYQGGVGDWDSFMTGPQPTEWGGSMTMRSAKSLQILWQQMQVGDLVLCWQSDRKVAVGLCRIAALVDFTDRSGEEQRAIRLRLEGAPFSPPVRLLDLKKSDPRFADMACLGGGFPSTLYETTALEARLLLKACGIWPASLKPSAGVGRTKPRSSSGGGFGSSLQNRQVEQAAVAEFRRRYKSWQLTDRQEDPVSYDFDAVKNGDERHIEVKGVKGSQPSFVITRAEAERAQWDGQWRLAVVTDALTKPKMREWTRQQFLQAFELSEISFMARLRP